MAKKTGKKKSGKREKQTEIMIISLFVLLVLLIGIIISVTINSRRKEPDKKVVTDETQTVVNEVKVPEDIYYYISRKTADVNFDNPKDNQSYMVYTVKLKETGEVLYTSPYLEPGKKIEQISMALDLPQGEYEVTVQCDMFLLQDKTPIGGAGHKRTLHVNP